MNSSAASRETMPLLPMYFVTSSKLQRCNAKAVWWGFPGSKYEMCRRSVWMLNDGGGEKTADMVVEVVECE